MNLFDLYKARKTSVTDSIFASLISRNMKRFGVVDLGTLTWTKTTTAVANENRFLSGGIASVVARPSSNTQKANIFCAAYETQSADAIYVATRGISINAVNGNVIIYDHDCSDLTTEQFKSAMSGIYLFYKLATTE